MKACRTYYLLWLILTISGASAMLSGCGQYGELYMPEPEQQEKDT